VVPDGNDEIGFVIRRAGRTVLFQAGNRPVARTLLVRVHQLTLVDSLRFFRVQWPHRSRHCDEA
jgi:hypothetical protein